MNQLPDEIIINILSSFQDLEFLVKLSSFLPNRYIFPCLFKSVIIQHTNVLDENYILVQNHDLYLFRFSFFQNRFVKISSYNLNKSEWWSPIKPYISDIRLLLDIKDQDTLYWGSKAENFLSEINLENLLCDIRLNFDHKYGCLKKLTLYDPDWLTSFDTASITNLIIHNHEIATKDAILELSGQAFPSLKMLDVTCVWIKVLDFICPLRELCLCIVDARYYPSIHKLKQLNVLILNESSYSKTPPDYERVNARFANTLFDEKSLSLETLSIVNVKISSLSLHSFPNLKKFDYTGKDGIKSLEGVPVNLMCLVLNSSELVSVPKFEQNNLVTLTITGTRIENLEGIFSECSCLSKADLSDNMIKEIPDILENSNVTWLDLKLNNLAHFKSFIFPKLKFLDLSTNHLTKIVSLKGCRSLQYLNVSNCMLKDIDFVQDLAELEELYADDNEINSVQPLGGRTNLKILNFSHNRLKDITPIYSCFNLRTLDLSSNKIERIHLIGLNHLSKVDVSNNLIHRFGDISLNESVNELLIKGNDITVLSSNMTLRKIKLLDLTMNRIKQVEDISQLQLLETLVLHNNFISDFIGIDGLRNLKYLNLKGCPIKSLEGLNRLSSLESLFFSESKFPILDGTYLQGMTSLAFLSIENSSLRQLKSMTMLQIEVLILSANKIEILEELECLPKLSTLNLSNNRIRKVGNSFGTFPSLEYLNLRSNFLKTDFGLAKIRTFSKLTVYCDHLDTSSTEIRQTSIRLMESSYGRW